MTFALLAASLLLGSSAAHACSSTADCLRLVELSGRETRTLEADFSQVKHVSLLDEPILSKGRLVFKKPGRLRLQIEEPEARSIVVSGNDVHITGVEASPSQHLAVASSPMAAMLRRLEDIFTGSLSNLDETFHVSARRRLDEIEVDMTTRDPSSKPPFRRILLRFGGPEWVLRDIRLEEPFGDSLRITLENVRRNVDVPDAAFRLGAER